MVPRRSLLPRSGTRKNTDEPNQQRLRSIHERSNCEAEEAAGNEQSKVVDRVSSRVQQTPLPSYTKGTETLNALGTPAYVLASFAGGLAREHLVRLRLNIASTREILRPTHILLHN